MLREIQLAHCAGRLVLGAIALSVLSNPAMSADDGHRQHSVHAHGHGVLQVAVEGQELVMALHIPAVNVVGFESAADTPQQRELVSKAIERFSKGDALFVPSKAASCTFEHAEVALAGMRGGEKHNGNHQHDQRERARKHEHGAGDGHSELSAEYHFHCDTPAHLASVEVEVFSLLRDAKTIDAQVVTSTHQQTMELTPQRRTVKLTR